MCKPGDFKVVDFVFYGEETGLHLWRHLPDYLKHIFIWIMKAFESYLVISECWLLKITVKIIYLLAVNYFIIYSGNDYTFERVW